MQVNLKQLRMSKTKFYQFRQMNSGNYWIYDKDFGIGHLIIIEAATLEAAESKFEAIGREYGEAFWDYCPCCGERWEYPSNGDVVPMNHNAPLDELKDPFLFQAFVHYADGLVKEFEFLN